MLQQRSGAYSVQVPACEPLNGLSTTCQMLRDTPKGCDSQNALSSLNLCALRV